VLTREADVELGDHFEGEVVGGGERERDASVNEERGERFTVNVRSGVRRFARTADNREAYASVDTDHRVDPVAHADDGRAAGQAVRTVVRAETAAGTGRLGRSNAIRRTKA
jgi:hypothetical protein